MCIRDSRQAGGQEFHHPLAAARGRLRQGVDARRRDRDLRAARQAGIDRPRHPRHRIAWEITAMRLKPRLRNTSGGAVLTSQVDDRGRMAQIGEQLLHNVCRLELEITGRRAVAASVKFLAQYVARCV